jgi:hypothetical protein
MQASDSGFLYIQILETSSIRCLFKALLCWMQARTQLASEMGENAVVALGVIATFA